MILSDPRMRLLVAALSNRILNTSRLKSDPNFLAQVERKSAQIFASSTDERSLEDVQNDTFIGEIGEAAIVKCLQLSKIEAVHNIEEVTLEKYWDVLAEGLKGEIKCQVSNDSKKYFGFSNPRKDLTMRQKWKSLDFIVAFYTKTIQDNLCVIPWMHIDSAAIDPSLDIYVKSKMNKGYFLKNTVKAQKYYQMLSV